MVYWMEIKTPGINSKICSFILGIIVGTIVYNLLNVQYSFTNINRISGINYLDSFLYLLMINLRYLAVIFVLSFFKSKDRIILFIIFIESFLLAGNIVIMILTGSYVLLYEIPANIFKIICALFMFSKKNPIVYRIFSLIILIVATALENLFFIKL